MKKGNGNNKLASYPYSFETQEKKIVYINCDDETKVFFLYLFSLSESIFELGPKSFNNTQFVCVNITFV